MCPYGAPSALDLLLTKAREGALSPTRRAGMKFGLPAGAAAAFPVERAAASLPQWFLQPVDSRPIPSCAAATSNEDFDMMTNIKVAV